MPRPSNRTLVVILLLAMLPLLAACATLQGMARSEAESAPALVVLLDNTGIASPAFRNPRKPRTVRSFRSSETVRYSNQTFDRTFLVTVPVYRPVSGREEPVADGVCGSAEPCRSACLGLIREYLGADWEPSAPLPGFRFTCKSATGFDVTMQIGPGESMDFPIQWLQPGESQPRSPVVRFTVDFYEQTEDPAHSVGYLSLEPVDPTDLSFEPDREPFDPTITTTLGWERVPAADPKCLGDPTRADQACLWNGDVLSHSPAQVSIEINERLGLRADARAVLRYQKGDLGDTAGDQAEATQYWGRVYGTQGIVLQGGKFQLLKPANGIAISEFGDAVSVAYSPASIALGHLLRRESATGVANDADLDHDVWTLEAGPYSFPRRVPFLRRLAVHGTYGEERLERDADLEKATAAVVPHTYTSYGGELFLGWKRHAYGSVAAYRSERDSRRRDDLADGRGHVALLRLNVPIWPTGQRDTASKPDAVVAFLAGVGSGDNPHTATREDYIGETAGSFSPESSLFFPVLAGRLRLGGAEGPSIEAGLSNKRFLGVQLTRTGFGPLAFLSKHVLQAEDVASETAVIWIHHLERERANGIPRALGTELGLELKVEVPKGVFWTVGGAYLEAGAGLEATALVTESPWRAAAGISFKL